MRRTLLHLRTFAAIGATNGLRVLGYRLALKLGVHPVQRIAAAIPAGDFFAPPVGVEIGAPVPSHWGAEAVLFGAHRVALRAGPPAWTADPLADPTAADQPLDQPPGELPPWWRIGDFAGGDIKRVWEFSRFDWAMTFAQRARNGDAASLRRLNAWIADWVRGNPPYRGPNWKCAQEASIRLLHLSVAALVLGREHDLTSPLRGLIDALVKRIVPTLSYARAQDNNHATSEAAALFIAGTWLAMAGKPEGEPLARRGRELLERHVARLFARDGSFSQYSLNYHRLALDTLSLAELWRQRAGQRPFGPEFRHRGAAAAEWLRTMVDPASGDAPNLGANDGANLLPLTDAPYRDYRPSVQLACRLFCDGRAFPRGPWDDGLAWLGLDPEAALPSLPALPATAVFDDGGYAVLRHGRAMALLRYPRFRFRPSQADALHVDLWANGSNVLRDGGSYSYNAEPRWLEYFGGVQSHNTVEFDGEPQMPRLSRFLLGDWLTTLRHERVATEDAQGFRASYRHRQGWLHDREVSLGTQLRVIDRVSGFARTATLRWRLKPGPWRLDGARVTDGRQSLTVTADVPFAAISLTTGHESRHYQDISVLPVLEVTVTQAGTITSEFDLAS